MAKSTKRVPLAGSARQLPAGAKVAGAAKADERIEVTVRVRARAGSAPTDAEIMALGAQPPRARRYLTRDQFAEKHGADPADIATIEAFAQAHGLTVARVHFSSRSVKLQGTIAAFSEAFGVKLKRVKVGARNFRMRTGPVVIPASLKGIIVGVHGLDNRAVASPHFRARRTSRGATAPRNSSDGSLAVTDIARLYNFPAKLTGEGQCIALIELNDTDGHGHVTGTGFQQSDIDAFFQRAGIAPAPQIVSIGVDGGGNHPGHSEADGEVVLDIEVAGAVAPGARIAVYFAPNTTNGFIDAVKAAVHDSVRTPSVVSISWGGPEDPGGVVPTMFLDGLNEAIRDAASMGVSVFVAAGDSGSADMDSQHWDGKPHTDFPASSPFSLACGGTKLQASGKKIVKESVWNGGAQGGAGGGGVSTYFALPTYQKSAKVPKSPKAKSGRGVPDLSGDADPATGYQVFLNGAPASFGGTSAVAPLLAGLTALINQSLKKTGKTAGFYNPLLYAAGPPTIRDITFGDNDIYGKLKGKYSAKAGWDACSGLGVPDGTALLDLLSK